jgi:hypothetical protein
MAQYTSINTHLGIKKSCCDDMESLGYIFMYFLWGSLPWQDFQAPTTQQKYNQIMNRRIITPTKYLCCGFPKEFDTYLGFSYKSMIFTDKPDYKFLPTSSATSMSTRDSRTILSFIGHLKLQPALGKNLWFVTTRQPAYPAYTSIKELGKITDVFCKRPFIWHA